MSNRRGSTLIEVLAATLILALSGLAAVDLVSNAAAAVSDDRRREREILDEDRLMSALSLLDRVDLDRRIGERVVGPYLVLIDRPEQALYRISLRRTESPTFEDLATVVFRPEAER